MHFFHQKKRKVKLDKVKEGLRPITLRFRAKDFGVHRDPLDNLTFNF